MHIPPHGHLDSIEGVQSPDSIVTKRRTCTRVFAALPEVKSLFDITPEVLEALRSKMLKALKKQSVNSAFIQLSAFLQHFVEKRILLQNPVRNLRKLKLLADPSPDFLDDEERRLLLALCDQRRSPFIQRRDRLLFTLILNTGLRRIEVSHLKWSDIDLGKRVLVVRSGKGGTFTANDGLLWIDPGETVPVGVSRTDGLAVEGWNVER